jgi:hypothetical protein
LDGQLIQTEYEELLFELEMVLEVQQVFEILDEKKVLQLLV